MIIKKIRQALWRVMGKKELKACADFNNMKLKKKSFRSITLYKSILT
jgi:hypothetical protein